MIIPFTTVRNLGMLINADLSMMSRLLHLYYDFVKETESTFILTIMPGHYYPHMLIGKV